MVGVCLLELLRQVQQRQQQQQLMALGIAAESRSSQHFVFSTLLLLLNRLLLSHLNSFVFVGGTLFHLFSFVSAVVCVLAGAAAAAAAAAAGVAAAAAAAAAVRMLLWVWTERKSSPAKLRGPLKFGLCG